MDPPSQNSVWVTWKRYGVIEGGAVVTLENLIFTMALLAALGCVLMAGLFYTFSFGVMNALNRQPPTQTVSAMQSINETIMNPLFFVLFLGTAAVCVISVVASPIY